MISLSLASARFLLLGVVAVLLLTLLRGRARDAAFLFLNCAFLFVLLLGPSRVAPALLMCALGYGLVRFSSRQPRWVLLASVIAYVLLFVYLRDYEFLHHVLPGWSFRPPEIVATVGLSFLFFKVLHTVIEARSGTLGPVDALSYVNYCLNFTTFMMGPIQRYQDYRAQWSGEERTIPDTFEAHLDAVVRILTGLFKAYVVAALIQPFVLHDAADLLTLGRVQLITGIVAFYFHLYFNFSGYCDVAIGLGSLMGVRPPENFDRPYLARSISDFWQRFHRSLTQWLTTYVFSPSYKWALGNRFLSARPQLAMSGALVLTMLVSGVWHGTTLGFALFGLVHGLYFVVFRGWENWAARRFGRAGLRALRERPAMHAAAVGVTFAAVSLSFVFFQLPAGRAFAVLGRLAGL